MKLKKLPFQEKKDLALYYKLASIILLHHQDRWWLIMACVDEALKHLPNNEMKIFKQALAIDNRFFIL